MGLWEEAPLRLGKVSSVRYRLGRWLPDGDRIVAVTDEGGDEHLIVFSRGSTGEPKRIRGDFGRVSGLYVAPGNALEKPDSDDSTADRKKGKKKSKKEQKVAPDLVVLTNNRHELILVNLTTGEGNVVDRSPYHRIAGVDWSPDSRWIAFGHSASERASSIRLYEIESGKITTLTGPDFFDVGPSFDPDGKYLYFISWRVFNPVYDSHYFDLGFPKGSRPYLLTLRNDIVSPFSMATRKPKPPEDHRQTRTKVGTVRTNNPLFGSIWQGSRTVSSRFQYRKRATAEFSEPSDEFSSADSRRRGVSMRKRTTNRSLAASWSSGTSRQTSPDGCRTR